MDKTTQPAKQKPATVQDFLRDLVKEAIKPENAMERPALIAGYAKQMEQRFLVPSIENKRAVLSGMQLARRIVLRRTEVPKDAKIPVRDETVLAGEACADAIDWNISKIEELQDSQDWQKYVTGDWQNVR